MARNRLVATSTTLGVPSRQTAAWRRLLERGNRIPTSFAAATAKERGIAHSSAHQFSWSSNSRSTVTSGSADQLARLLGWPKRGTGFPPVPARLSCVEPYNSIGDTREGDFWSRYRVCRSLQTLQIPDVQRIDRQFAARRTKLMKELRERIAEVERGSPGSTAGALHFGPRSPRCSTSGWWPGSARETRRCI